MFENHDVIDLSWPIHTNMPVFPMVLKTFVGIYMGHKDSFRPPNLSSQTNIIVMSDHAGTHIDAPLHFNPDGNHSLRSWQPFWRSSWQHTAALS